MVRSRKLPLFALAVLPLLVACGGGEQRPPPREPAPPVRAEAPHGHHPAYLHALSDLRNARANIERKGGDAAMHWDERLAIDEIDRAIAEIKQASIDDGKNLEDHPPIDAHEPRSGRLHKGLAALKQARADIEHEEDNAEAKGLRGRAVQHIDAAIHATEEGVADAARAS